MANGHGGRRSGAGRKKKPLMDKIMEGSTDKHRPKVLKFEGGDAPPDPEPPKWITFYGRKTTGEPDADEIYKSTVAWLKTTGCLHLINPDFILDYAILKANWFETQRQITRTGMAYSPDDKNVMLSNPMIDVLFKYHKMTEMAWDKIWRIVAQNCEENFGGSNPHDDFMEKLLNMNMGK